MFWQKWRELRKIRSEFEALSQWKPPSDPAAQRRALAELLGTLRLLSQRARKLDLRGESLALEIEKKVAEREGELSKMAAGAQNSLLKKYQTRSRDKNEIRDAGMLGGG